MSLNQYAPGAKYKVFPGALGQLELKAVNMPRPDAAIDLTNLEAGDQCDSNRAFPHLVTAPVPAYCRLRRQPYDYLGTPFTATLATVANSVSRRVMLDCTSGCNDCTKAIGCETSTQGYVTTERQINFLKKEVADHHFDLLLKTLYGNLGQKFKAKYLAELISEIAPKPVSENVVWNLLSRQAGKEANCVTVTKAANGGYIMEQDPYLADSCNTCQVANCHFADFLAARAQLDYLGG